MTPSPPPRATALAPSRTSAVVVVCAVLVLLSGWAVPAGAHGADPGIRYQLTDVPEVEGLTVQVVRGLAGQLVLANTTDQAVEVLDDDGRAFLRIGPDGVEADVASPTWQASDRPFGLGGGDPTAGSPTTPRWVSLSESSSWGWYDHRLHALEVTAPADADGPVVLDTWSVPLRMGARELAVAGETVGGPVLGHVAARLISDSELAEGVRVDALPGQAPGLFLVVAEDREVLVRGEAGEPFLRFADGGVEANAASPTWHRVGRGADGPATADAEAPPSWQSVAGSQQYGWVEPRAAAPEVDGNPPDGQVLSTWAVPLEVDGQPATIVGELRWVRTAAATTPHGRPVLLDVALAVAGLLVVGALMVVRRRARRDAT